MNRERKIYTLHTTNHNWRLDGHFPNLKLDLVLGRYGYCPQTMGTNNDRQRMARYADEHPTILMLGRSYLRKYSSEEMEVVEKNPEKADWWLSYSKALIPQRIRTRSCNSRTQYLADCLYWIRAANTRQISLDRRPTSGILVIKHNAGQPQNQYGGESSLPMIYE